MILTTLLARSFVWTHDQLMPLVTLDTNGLNNLTWRGDPERIQALQARLRQPSCAQVLVVGTILDELSPMLLDPRAQDPNDPANCMLRFLLSGVKVRGLAQPLERIQAEVDATAAKAPRPFWRCLHPERDTRLAIAGNMSNRQTLEECAGLFEESKKAIAEERALRLKALASLPPEFDLNNVHLDWLTDEEVKRRLKQMDVSLPAADPAGLESRQIPTLWYIWGVVWAYRYLHFLEPERVEKSNDAQDFLLYRDSAYADIFVSDDAILTRCIELCPEPKARVMSFNEWSRTF